MLEIRFIELSERITSEIRWIQLFADRVNLASRYLLTALNAYRARKCADTIGTEAGSLGWPFPMLKYIFQMKYTEAILANSTRKLLRFEITKILIAVQ